jgi:hypothetical protein
VQQTAFDNIKTTIAKDVVLVYPDYSQGFEIYTDSSKFQLEAVITQNNWTTGLWHVSAEN